MRFSTSSTRSPGRPIWPRCPTPTPSSPEMSTPTAPPVIAAPHTYTSITDKIAGIVLTRGARRGWILGFTIGLGLITLLTVAVTMLLYVGTGMWGVNTPVAWAFAIANVVWWIGSGHFGTRISAIILFRRLS